MRHSNHHDRGRRLPILVVGLLAMLLAACGSSAPPSGTPGPEPTPVITPDPHLREPVTADQIWRAMSLAKLPIVANNANSGGGNPDIVKQINADLGSWPLRIVEFRSSTALARTLDWKAGGAPGGDEAPYAWAGLNILVVFGPISARAPSAPDAARQAAAASIVAVLDPLLWPLAQRSVVPVPSRTAVPPSLAPTPKPSAKPTKAPAKSPSPKPAKSKAP